MNKKILHTILLVFITSFPSWAQETKPFVTEWVTSSNEQEIIIQLNSGFNYDFTYEWKDASDSTITTGTHTSSAGDFSTTFSEVGTYRLAIEGDFPHFIFHRSKEQLIDVLGWGDIKWQSFVATFLLWKGEAFSATDAPDLQMVTDMTWMFLEASNFNGDLSHWDVGNVTIMESMFAGAVSYDNNGSDLFTWDVSKVTNMKYMFEAAYSFNRRIDTWDVGNVVDMSNMFDGATSFNRLVGDWDVSQVTNMHKMFEGATAFNNNGYNLNKWDVGNVTDMSQMFEGATSFNQDIGNWKVSKVTNMSSMFEGATAYNNNGNDLKSWNVSSVTNMSHMFTGASSFNASLNTWNVSNVKDMSGMFAGASKFDRNIAPWNATKVTDMSSMFEGASSFNNNGTELTDWNVSNVKDMSSMFAGATSFDIKVKYWNVGKVTDMSSMFDGASSFDRNLKNWNVSKVTNMSGMFKGASEFNGGGSNLNKWNVSKVTNMSGMFEATSLFNKKIKDWNVSNVTDMSNMFALTDRFNKDLSAWNVSRVRDMSGMFLGAKKFLNGGTIVQGVHVGNNLNDWNVSKVTNMSFMFAAMPLNVKINDWNVSNVTDMSSMFNGAVRFSRDLTKWDVRNVTDMSDMFDHSDLDNDKYNNLLIAWASLNNLKQGVPLGATDLQYCSGADAREQLISEYGWIITDGGPTNSCNSARILEEEEDAIALTETADELADAASILVYPNPTSNVLTIQSQDNVNAYLTDLMGKTVISKRSGKDMQLDISAFEAGTYLLHIQNGADRRVKKIIKTQ